MRDLISACNAAGALARDHGLTFGMHNHWWEFEPVEGDRPIRLLHESLDPDIFWQLDVYWAQYGRRRSGGRARGVGAADRVAPLEGWPGRPRRADDGARRGGRSMSRESSGRLAHPADWVIELDDCATDSLEAARQSRVYLESLSGGGPGRSSPVKIATFNVNSVNARLPVLLRWLAESRPDVACLQELKAAAGEVPRRRAPGGGLPRDLARAEGVERRRHPGPGG